MLLELKVENLGIIEDLTWRLSPGLNIITGETGAGKSLVIDALELLLSGRVVGDVIRYGASETRIEGVFDPPAAEKGRPLRELLAQRDLDTASETLVISSLIRRQAPVVSRVNGHAVPRSFLQAIGRLLVDIHGQSEHSSLLDNRTHLNFLDAYGSTLDSRRRFAVKAAALRQIEQELAGLRQSDQDRARREEYLRYQVDEINRANLREGEEEELEGEWRRVSAAETVKALTYAVYRALYEEDTAQSAAPALDRLNEAVRALKKLADFDPALGPQLTLLAETTDRMAGVARAIHAYGERVNFDPARLAEIDARREQIRNLKRKYGSTIAETLAFAEKAAAELAAASGAAARIIRLEETRQNLRREMGSLGFTLSQERHQAAGRLAAAVKRELADLNMPQVSFEIARTQRSDPAGILFPDGNHYAFNDEGTDLVEFFVATNPGEPAKPLARIASTGELSRFTLALKGALAAADRIPVLVFDEIDIGIGGRSGEVIGKKLWRLSREHQVICVTHLPQLAAFADVHFRVRKETTGTRTVSILEALENGSRLGELAAMLTGATVTPSARASARELLSGAAAWKETSPEQK